MRYFLAIVFGLFLLHACKPKTKPTMAKALGFTQVPTPALPGSKYPYLLTHEGKLLMSWVETRNDSSFLQMAEKTATSWSPVSTIASGTDWFVNWADFPEIFLDTAGYVYAHYLKKNGSDTYAYGVEVAQKGRNSTAVQQLGNPYQDTSKTEHGFVSFFSSGGRPSLLWLDGRKYKTAEKEMSLRSAQISPDGTFTADIELDARTCDCCQTDAVNTQSGAIVVYRDRSDTEVRDIYKLVNKHGAWSKPAPVFDDGWEISGCPVNGPAVAAKGDQVVVAWFTAAQDTAKVQVAFSADGGENFSAPIRADLGAPLGRVDVLWSKEGQVYLSWMEKNAQNEGLVMLRSISPKWSLSAAQIVSHLSPERASGFPVMTEVSGKLYLAWTQEGTPTQIELWVSN